MSDQKMSDQKNTRPNGTHVLDVEELKQPAISMSDMKLLSMAQYFITDTAIFDALPLSNAQKVEYLKTLMRQPENKE